MCIINIFRSAYSDELETLEVESGKTISESIDADLDNAVISVNGYEKDKDYVLADGDLCTIRVFPAANDAAQNAADFLVALGVGLLVGLATLAAGPAVAFAAGVIAATAWSVGSNITMAVTKKSWTAHIMPDWPTIPDTNSPEQTKALPHLRGSENQSLMGKPIPFVMGRHLMTPYYCGKMYTEIAGEDGEDQYARVLLMLGYRKMKVTDIKLGELLIASNDADVMDNDNGQRIVCDQGLSDFNAEIELCQSDRECDLYPQKVYEEPVQIELTNADGVRLESKRFSAKNPMMVQVEITLPCLLSYDDEGKEQSADVSVGVKWRWHTLDGSDPWKDFGAFDGCNSYSGGVSKFTRTKNKQMRFVATKTFKYSDLPQITRVDPLTQQPVRELSPSTMVDLMIYRASENSTDTKVRHQVYLTSVRTWTYDYRKTKEGKVIVPERPVDETRRNLTSRLAVRIKVTGAVGDQLRAINCVLESYARVWNRDSRRWSDEEVTTRNPAAIAMKALTSPMLGTHALTDNQIDLQAFGAWHEFCDDLHTRDIAEVNAINKRNCVLECNGIVYQQMKLSDLLEMILYTGRAFYVRNGRKLSVIMDKARSQIVAIFNNQNVISASNSKKFIEFPDGVKVSFIDEDCGWMTNTMYVNFDDGSTMIKKDYEYQPLELRCITHRNQVWHTCMNEQAKSRMRPEVWTRTVTTEGHLAGLMDLVQIQDDTIVVGIGDGAEVKSLEYDVTGKFITAIHTNGRFNVADTGKEYGIKIMQADGINEPAVRVCKVAIPEAGYHSSFRLVSSIFTGERVVPQEGDLVAFGEYGKETIDAIVVGKKPGEDGKFELSLVPYSHDPYEYEKTAVMPVFDSKVNPPQPFAGIQELPKDYASHSELYQSIQVLSSGTEYHVPDAPVMGNVYASMDYIHVNWESVGVGLNNTIRRYVVEMMKNGVFEVIGETADTSWDYHFQRPNDGYPEASDLSSWRVRVKAVNIYGKESGWSQEAAINTDSYGTWLLAAPKVAMQVRDRHVTLTASQPPRSDGRQVYGSIRNAITIRRPDIDTDADTWYTPGAALNPYPETAGDGTELSNELNYRLDTTEPEMREEVYVQTMPLKGQGMDGSGVENTLYLFRVVAQSEAGESPATTVQALALCTNIVDLVQANITQKEAYVPDLSAISANLGSINQGGMGNDNNRWDLSTFVDSKGMQRWEGLFRVGNHNQYLRVNPVINDIGQIIDYKMVFKVGTFELTSTASNIKGEVIVMTDDRPWERTRITPTGTYYEYQPSQEAGWQTVAKQETRGLMSQLMYSGQSIILTNSSITQRRRNGVDLGRPYLSESSLVYHFDEDFLDQHGNRGYTLEGEARLVDMDDNTPLVPIDFTAAILSVAPYSEVGKSAYGKFSLTHPLGSSNVFTVDFWIQYIWAENQVLLDIGVPSDRIQIICSSGEPNYNEPQDGEPPYNWEVEAADRLPYNVAAGAAVYVNHQGQSAFDTIDLEDIGFIFTPNTWEHLAVVLTDTEITLYLRDKRIPFARYGTGIQDATAILNASRMSFQLDELLVDTTMARDFAEFVAGTHDKVPWAALDHSKRHYVLDAADPDNITGNLFTSRAFERAVLRVLENNKEAL